jgi:hypothetical protein
MAGSATEERQPTLFDTEREVAVAWYTAMRVSSALGTESASTDRGSGRTAVGRTFEKAGVRVENVGIVDVDGKTILGRELTVWVGDERVFWIEWPPGGALPGPNARFIYLAGEWQALLNHAKREREAPSH